MNGKIKLFEYAYLSYSSCRIRASVEKTTRGEYLKRLPKRLVMDYPSGRREKYQQECELFDAGGTWKSLGNFLGSRKKSCFEKLPDYFLSFLFNRVNPFRDELYCPKYKNIQDGALHRRGIYSGYPFLSKIVRTCVRAYVCWYPPKRLIV